MEKERRKFGMALVLAVLFATLAFASVGCVSAATHYVNPTESIQAAVDAADLGDTIVVRDGTYTENINVYKRLTIKSENGSENCIVLAENPNDHVFKVTTNYVNISGFTIEDASFSCGILLTGVNLTGVNNCTISTNIVSGNSQGIYLTNSIQNIIANNSVKNNSASGISLMGSNNNRITDNIASNNVKYNGIVLSLSSNNEIRNNIANSNHFNGIGLWKSSDENIIANNTAKYNGNSGITLTNSNNNEIRNNIANSNHFNGIYLNNSNDNRITDNDASNTVNWDGISLSSSNNNEVRNNVANFNNYNGIVLWISSDENIIANNNAKHNGDCGIVANDANNNKIYLNNFMDNGNNVYSIGSTNVWNSPSEITYTYKGSTYTNYSGNYWDDYTGTDGNGDGIGDATYSIDSDKDYYPLMVPWENYDTSPIEFHVHNLKTGKNFSSIQAAIDDSDTKDRHTITVDPGTYTENINVYKRLTIKSENGSENCIVQAANPNDPVFEVTANYVNITGFTVKAARDSFGIFLAGVNNCNISTNIVSSNLQGIFLSNSIQNIIANNIVKHNGENGILLMNSNNNRIIDNNASHTVECDGIALSSSSNNEVRNNIANSNNYNGIVLWISSDENIIANNTAKHNGDFGIIVNSNNNNRIYLNNFMGNGNNNAYSISSTNIWNSPSKITYTYKGSTYTNYLGNFWSDYTGSDTDADGIGESAYSIDGDKDNYPLMQQWENYFIPLEQEVFDTGEGTYPSIMGTHKGTITPNKTIIVHKLCTCPSIGTSGHIEYVRF